MRCTKDLPLPFCFHFRYEMYGCRADDAKRILSIIETLKEFRNILLGQEEKIQMFNRLLPVTIWITRFQLNREFIEIEVLDSRQNEVTRLLDLIDSKVGPSRLILNEYIVIDEKKLNRMVIRISNAKND